MVGDHVHQVGVFRIFGSLLGEKLVDVGGMFLREFSDVALFVF